MCARDNKLKMGENYILVFILRIKYFYMVYFKIITKIENKYK